MRIQFDLERLGQVIRTDATVPDMVDFLATHTPFRSLSYLPGGSNESNEKKVSEESFFQENILGQRNRHQFLVVQGDPGSGKSHFVRWAHYRYLQAIGPEEEVVLFIARSQNTLKGALEQIIQSDALPPGFRAKELKKLAEASQHLSDEALGETILYYFAVASEQAHRDGHTEVLEKRYLRYLRDFLVDREIMNYLRRPGGPVDRIKARLLPDDSNQRKDHIDPRFSPGDFALDYKFLRKMQRAESARGARTLAEDLANKYRGPQLREKIARFLNNYLEFVVQSCTSLRTADLKQIFEQLRIELKKAGKNLSLFIEDITSFTGIDRALMEVLVTEHEGHEYNEQFCRLLSVVGVTNDYYANSIPDNIKDRVTGRVKIDHAALNTPDEVAEMAARYLNALHVSKGELAGWVQGGAREENLPIARGPLEHSWSAIQLPDGRPISIFPFNKNMLARLYESLEVQTPRRFLQDVVSYILRIYQQFSGPGEFPPAVQHMQGSYKIPLWAEAHHEAVVQNAAGPQADNVSTLLRLWGEGHAYREKKSGTVTVGGLTEGVFKSFGLKFIEGISREQVGGRSEKRSGEEDKDRGTNGEKEKEQKKEKEKKPSEGERKFKNIQEELERWLLGAPLASYSDLRDDVLAIFFDFIDWEAEKVPAPLVQAYLTKKRVSIEGQVGQFYEGYQVRRSESSKRALLALAAWRYLGNRSWNFPNSTDHLANLYRWLRQEKGRVVAAVLAPQGQDPAKWDLPQWGLWADFYGQAVAGRLSPECHTLEELYHALIRPWEDLGEQPGRSKAWNLLQDRLGNKRLKVNHDFVLNAYNRFQGGKPGHTGVYFIDAALVLETLKKIDQAGWDFSRVLARVQGISLKKDQTWYLPLELLDILQKNWDNAQQQELDAAGSSLEKIEQLLGPRYTGQDVEELWDEIIDFFRNVLPRYNESYPEDVFAPLLDGTLSSGEFLKIIQALQNLLGERGTLKKILLLSAHPLGALQPYLDVLTKLDGMLDEKTRRYQQRLQALNNSGAQNVQQVIEDARDAVEELRQGTARLGGVV